MIANQLLKLFLKLWETTQIIQQAESRFAPQTLGIFRFD